MQAASPTRSGAGPSDAALVIAARAGEAWASEALFRRYAKMVNGLALRLIGRDSDVDDLVQDTFVEALQSLDRLKEPQAFAGWLRSILVHRTGKLLRRRRLLERLGLGRGSLNVDPDALIAKSTPADVATELRALYSKIEALPTDLRIALVLRKVEGYTLEEVAEISGASLATVKRRITRAEGRLRSGEKENDPK